MVPVPNGDEMAIPSWWACATIHSDLRARAQNKTPRGRIDGELWPMLSVEKKSKTPPLRMHSMSHTGIPELPFSPATSYKLIPRTATNRQQLVPETGLLRMIVRALIDTACAGNQDAPRVSWKCSNATVWVRRYVGSSASLPSSRVPPLQTAAPYSVCCAGDSTSYERFS